MTPERSTLNTIYDGWENYQRLLVRALAPLSAEQLALRPAPRLRSIGQIAMHMIGARARWFHNLMGEGDKEFAAMARWDRRGKPARPAVELVYGLETTWRVMREAVDRWSPEDWVQTYPGEPPGEPETITRHWVIWHLVEHDLHHGGEISYVLGMNKLSAPDI